MNHVNNKGNNIYRDCRNCNLGVDNASEYLWCLVHECPIYTTQFAVNCNSFNCDEN